MHSNNDRIGYKTAEPIKSVSLYHRDYYQDLALCSTYQIEALVCIGRHEITKQEVAIKNVGWLNYQTYQWHIS